MTLVKFEPTRDFESIHNTIQKYFDDFSSLKSPFHTDDFSPRIDISEKENHVIVTAEIPGVNKEDLKLTLQDNILTIEGEKKNEIVEKEKKYYREERRFGISSLQVIYRSSIGGMLGGNLSSTIISPQQELSLQVSLTVTV